MVLPEALELQFEEELTEFEKERSMEYITSIERRGISKGLNQGLNQGLQHGQAGVILRQLNRRLGQVDSYLETTIRALGTPALESLAVALLDFNSLSDLTLWLENHAK
jgi:flagellar biosynthesis/type III secretory pathway protein FliH